MENNNIAFAAINTLASNANVYTTIALLDRATIARILFDAGYNSSYAKRINPEWVKRQQWDLCRE